MSSLDNEILKLLKEQAFKPTQEGTRKRSKYTPQAYERQSINGTTTRITITERRTGYDLAMYTLPTRNETPKSEQCQTHEEAYKKIEIFLKNNT